ncbi:MAG: TonB-dependent receptor plug domain-containing protein [Undibacterium sp.]|nr:TonB-dependent receptor plug domain-containing protein [Opitutaceae bacterium]
MPQTLTPFLLRVSHSVDALRRVVILLALAALASAAWAATPAAKRHYELTSGDAATTLRQFVEQSGEEIIYVVPRVRGVKTHAVKGSFTAREVLERMLANSVLVVVQDKKTGALMIQPVNADTPGPPPGPQPHPPAPADKLNPTNPRTMTPKKTSTWLASLFAMAAALDPLSAQSTAGNKSKLSAEEIRQQALTEKNATAKSEEQTVPVVLSPFEVVSDNRGYHAGNTMSGTRLNSKIEDLGASISVVTKEQMTDFAMLDFNDIANYEAGTEGTGNFTDYSFNRNGQQISNVTLNPTQANRLRGVGSANTTIGNFETSGRVPIDPLNTESVEISRGPNAAIFGIGTASGTVNTVPTSANLTRNKTQITTRGDSFDGYRLTLDINQVLLPEKLAIRGSYARQYDGFTLKPSGTKTDRYNAMARYRPFKNTMFTGSFNTYRLQGNRPNSNTPSDLISGWLRQGSPTFNATNSTITVNGVTRPRTADDITAYTTSGTPTQIYVDQNGLGYWGTGQSTLSNTPATVSQVGRLYDTNADPDALRNQPLFQRFAAVHNKEIYDWSTQNIALLNSTKDKARFATVLLDQVVLDTPRQLLAFQAGWFHEDGQRYARNLLAGDTRGGAVLGFIIDVNEVRLNGTPNPYFRRPYIPTALAYDSTSDIDRDTYRGQVAYKLDLTNEKNGLRWLGLHQVSAYNEYKKFSSRNFFTSDNITSKHTWLPAGTLNTAGTGAAGANVRYYVGDSKGQNMDFLPQPYTYGQYTLNYGNDVTGFTQEPVQFGKAILNFSGRNSNQLRIQKAQGIILQSHLLQDRIVTTFGERRDELYTRAGGPVRYNLDGITLDQQSYDSWATGDWKLGKGPTRTAGVVVRPLPWFNVFYNRSDSFVPESKAQDLFLKILPDPSGNGSDAGFGLNLFGGKLFIRANQYTTKQINSRTGSSASLGGRIQRIEFNDASDRNGLPRDLFRLQAKANEWFIAEAAAAGTTLTEAQLETKVSNLMQLPVEYLRPFANNVTATNDVIAKGREVEINYNPTTTWTLRANVTEQKAIDANISPDIGNWLAQRIPVWEKIVDPLLETPWYTTSYGTSGSAKTFVDGLIIAPLKLAKALEGKSRPQVRKYRVNLSTNYRLQGFDNPIVKRFNVGGALRWEDKGAIGYYGVQQRPNIVTELDTNRPIYDGAHTYVDLLVGYRAPFFSKKIMATWQLNIRNVNESGRLQKVGANPDGLPTAYRIVTPRQFILSATFDL